MPEPIQSSSRRESSSLPDSPGDMCVDPGSSAGVCGPAVPLARGSQGSSKSGSSEVNECAPEPAVSLLASKFSPKRALPPVVQKEPELSKESMRSGTVRVLGNDVRLEQGARFHAQGTPADAQIDTFNSVA